ncbi:MAG TPA: phosphomannomutase [Myxococcota bacterium]|nr:phosphomannomutase [Myxococcota bacterium]HQK51995.1 phosphomannomutase [Myxococcota bacterium]
MTLPACFKAYDIRGRVPDELDETLAEGIGRALARRLRQDREEGIGAGERASPEGPITVALGRDIRLSSPTLAGALARGLQEAGADVVDLGLCGTEMVYFAVFHLGLDGGVMITASHNPKDYNGLKLVRVGSRPISGDSGLRDVGAWALQEPESWAGPRGTVRFHDPTPAFLDLLHRLVPPESLAPLRVVFDTGNGCAGPLVRTLAEGLPLRASILRERPDGEFPQGVPNPLLPENRDLCARAVLDLGADVGIAFDGDFDRCFFFDDRGTFVEGYYLVGLLAQEMLRDRPGSRIVHDPRLYWNTEEVVREASGIPVRSKTGHAFIKERMRAEGALYGGEMSAHHYFQDFGYCDSGMVPWLKVLALLTRLGLPLSEVLADRMARYPCSGEINRRVPDIPAAIRRVERHFEPGVLERDDTDGLSLSFDRWRFNLRGSNTEPLLRLNVETRGDPDLLQRKTAEVLAVIDAGE